MSGKRKKRKNKEENEQKKKSNKKMKKILLRILITIIILCTIGAGILFGVLFGLIKGEWSLSEEKMAIAYSNSTVLDMDGNLIATLSGDENRIIISKNEMSPYLEKAFISIEDERFETHKGVDLKRTLGATLTFITNKGNSSYGGSTITQQVVKNLTDERDDSGLAGVTRKVKEMARAYQLEKIWSKDQIIELYMNLIPLGGELYGVEMASRNYFNKSAKDLTVVEAAYLAGITHAPSTYNPFGSSPYGTDESKTKRINKRVTDVCYKMHELERLSDEEYQAALQEIDAGIKFEKGVTSNNTNHSYHTEAAISQIVEELMTAKNMTRKEAELHLYGGGYTIYTTQDTEMQNMVQEAYLNKDWITTATITVKDENGESVKKKEQMQSGMVIIDHSTGYVVAGAGALGEKTAWGTNRMTSAEHQPGSSIKPLAVIGPSLQEGTITAATVIDDTPVSYGTWSPNNDSRSFNGLMNIRNILKVSRNVPEVKMLNKLTFEKSVEYLKLMGISTIAGDEGLSLALGGTTNGISPLEMAGAYSTIANNGIYIEPTFYTKVLDAEGNVVIEKKQETHRVFSEQNAWILQSLLTEPTGTGKTGSSGATGWRAALKGYQTCGKTGTTDDSRSTWFCGFTPYYTASMYFGYDMRNVGKAPGSSRVAERWASIMKKVHNGLEKKEFEKPDGITSAKVCTKSGLLPTDLCGEAGCVYTEYFVEGTVPKKRCSTHVEAMACGLSGETNLLASENCTAPVRKVFITRDNSENSTSWKKAGDADNMLPTDYCTHETTTIPEVPTIPSEPNVPSIEPTTPEEPGGEENGENADNNETPENPTPEQGEGTQEGEEPVAPTAVNITN